MNRNLGLLAICQGLFLTNNVIFIAMTGKVAIQPRGARLRPIRPLMAMKITLLVRNRPWQMASKPKFRFMPAV